MSSTSTGATSCVVAAASAASAVAGSATEGTASAVSAASTPSLASAFKRKRFSSSAEDLAEQLSPAMQPTASKHSRHAVNHPPPQMPSSSATPASAAAAAAIESVRRAVYIQLAAESPHRSDVESEDSMYGSFHACETEECRDTSDTDSYSTDEFATLDVLEYEIPSDSSTNEELYSHDSSSGTDDFVVTAAQLARAIFASQQSSRSNNSDNNSKVDEGTERPDDDGGRGDGASTDFELFADTEESDAATDPELGRADYWTCVKCKNRQNNPMYRYCERCYQIRKTHFPPRPKLQKTRSAASAAFGGRSATASQQHQLQQQQRGYDGTTDDEDGADGCDGAGTSTGAGTAPQQQLMRLRQQRTEQRRARSRRMSATVAQRRTASNSAADDSDEAHHSPALSDTDMFHTQSTVASASASQRRTSQPPAGCTPAHTPPTHLPLFTSNRDSGFQSSSTSTADLTPDERAGTVAATLGTSSQETYCSDVDEPRDNGALDGGVSVAITGSSSTLSNVSSLSGLLSVTRSASSCSAASQLDDCYDPHETAATLNASGIESAAAAAAAHSSVVVEPPARRCVFSLTPPPQTAVPQDNITNGGSVLVASGSGASLADSCGGNVTDTVATTAVVATAAAEDVNGMCMMCLTEPKNGVFVHSRFLHLCCCYRCAVKVWNKQKRCPICNCKVKNVMKLFVH